MLTFARTTEIPGELTEYAVLEDGVEIGTLYREWDVMTEWGIDALLEERFGPDAASGHDNVRSAMAELKRLDQQQKKEAKDI